MTAPAAEPSTVWQQARRSPVADLIQRHRAEMSEIWQRHKAELRHQDDTPRTERQAS